MKSKIKLFDSILVLNFSGAKEFKIFELIAKVIKERILNHPSE